MGEIGSGDYVGAGVGGQLHRPVLAVHEQLGDGGVEGTLEGGGEGELEEAEEEVAEGVAVEDVHFATGAGLRVLDGILSHKVVPLRVKYLHFSFCLSLLLFY